MGGKGSGGARYGNTKNNPFVQMNNPANIDPDVNHQSIAFGKDLLALPDYDHADPEAMQARFYDFLDLCDKHKMRPLVSACAQALGLPSHEEMIRCLSNDPQAFKRNNLSWESLKVLQKSYQFLKTIWENNLVNEKGNPVKWIFLGKNYFGMKDQVEQIHYKAEDRRELRSPDEIAADYAAMVGQPLDTPKLKSGKSNSEDEVEAVYEEVEE